MSDAEDDVFARIEARFVELSGLLEQSRRYRALAASSAELYRSSALLSANVRSALRAGDASVAESLESRAVAVIEAARARLDEVLGAPEYRSLIDAIAAADDRAAASLAPRLFADVEAAGSVARVYQPLGAKRGESGVEPEEGARRITALAEEGFAPAPGPGVGGDDAVHPIRFYEGLEGLDVPVLLEVDGAAIPLPLFRAVGLGEILVYAARIRVPFRVAIRLESPDDWLEARPGGYERYRERWLEALGRVGLTAIDVS